MKTLYMVGGPMGVGKTEVCKILKSEFDRAVFQGPRIRVTMG